MRGTRLRCWGAPFRGPCSQTISAGRKWRSGAAASFAWLGIVENFREFKIDDAKTAVGLTIRDVARIGIVVAHAVLLDFGEEFLDALVVDAIDTRAATGGDDAERV